jgi:hypothetical protein
MLFRLPCAILGFGDEERSLLMTVAEKNEDNVRLAMQLARANGIYIYIDK